MGRWRSAGAHRREARREKAVMSTADERRRAPSHNTRRRTWRGPEPHGRRRLDTRQCSVAKRRGKIPVPSRPRRNDLLVFNEPRRSGYRHRGVYSASTSNAGAAGAARVRPTPTGERTRTPAGSSAGEPRDATTRQPRCVSLCSARSKPFISTYHHKHTKRPRFCRSATCLSTANLSLPCRFKTRTQR